jgi:transcriptional regulator with XRE-family HTH domain
MIQIFVMIEMVMTMNLKEFGVFFAELREKSGYRSQRELADKSGVSHSTINRIEAGTHKVSPETLKALTPFLKGITYEELMERAGYIDNEPEKDEKPVNRAFLAFPEDVTEEERTFLEEQLKLQLEIFRKLKRKDSNK